ncbi:MAG: Magnesium transporter [Candidatus Gallionella acididurans]|uniref:Magnesium transporter n=1 Tax=Candidatus Gallionella acididurans TaxID=1796491 RepID=A0A139BQD7_9PROT|nr:MAG: Magnesium transporter [Candidatus Gallionella acididurans]
MINSSDILHGKILIVDDLEANVLLLKRLLDGAGYVAVTSTMDPSAVCELHLKNRYDLILLDLQMPGMNGFQVLEGLKQIEQDGYLPVLVITAQPGHKLHALQAGAKDFISKPFEIPEVLARVHNMLEVRLLHGETKRYSTELEQKVEEVEASRDQISRKSDEIKRLYNDLVKEQKRSLELSAQPGTMVGVEKEERIATPWLRSLRLRHPWLQFNLFTSLLGGGVVLLFHDTINRLLILAVFVPILISQTTNTGSQVLAITLRGLALGELKAGKEKLLILKEALLGLLNGMLVGLVAATAMYWAATLMHLTNAPMLSVVVFLAMTGSSTISGIFGAIVPLALKKFGTDPATASSIVLTTGTDVVALALLFGLAKVMIK